MEEEIQVRFKGNSLILIGSATLIQEKNQITKSGNLALFVAKKILLGKLTSVEKEKACLEVELMKKLHHPNIVKYHNSFIEDGMLIIVMEYCEEGDLSHHIKRQKKKAEFYKEKKLLN